jgi:outer membrane protein OmpA-like peptidoglycan-associated protein
MSSLSQQQPEQSFEPSTSQSGQSSGGASQSVQGGGHGNAAALDAIRAGQSVETGADMSQDMCDGEVDLDPALQSFLDHGKFGPLALQPPTDIGGFNASYDPTSGGLEIHVQGSVDFIDGLSWDGTTITSNHSDLDQAAIDGNALPDDPGKLLFLADFQWGADTDDWLTNMLGNVTETWEDKYSFWVDRLDWECVTAWVDVNIDLVAGQSRGGDMLFVETYKCPDDGSYDVGALVNSETDDPHGTTMVLSSRDGRGSDQATADGDSLLQYSVDGFGFDSSDMPADGGATLDTFAANFLDANNDATNPITITGRASSEGNASYNEGLAQRRAETVQRYLNGKGVQNTRIDVESSGEDGADATGDWRRVDLTVGDGRAQDVASHEFGHVFGLTDHYDNAGEDLDGDGVADRGGSITGTGEPAGTLSDHDQLAKDIGVSGGAVYENNDGIQSLGTNVEPANYCTFGWALQTLTGIPEWKINA